MNTSENVTRLIFIINFHFSGILKQLVVKQKIEEFEFIYKREYIEDKLWKTIS